MKIAVLGYGTIGRGVYEILSNPVTDYTKKIQVSYIWIRKGKEKALPEMCDDFNIILQDKEVEVVVELLGGIEPAHTMILEALRAGKHVVTANKKVTAQYLKEFLEVAKEHHVQFLFEATTGGGIPWVRAVEKVKRIDEVSDFHGIFNGTTNYILDRMYKEGAEFDDVLILYFVKEKRPKKTDILPYVSLPQLIYPEIHRFTYLQILHLIIR